MSVLCSSYVLSSFSGPDGVTTPKLTTEPSQLMAPENVQLQSFCSRSVALEMAPDPEDIKKREDRKKDRNNSCFFS